MNINWRELELYRDYTVENLIDKIIDLENNLELALEKEEELQATLDGISFIE